MVAACWLTTIQVLSAQLPVAPPSSTKQQTIAIQPTLHPTPSVSSSSPILKNGLPTLPPSTPSTNAPVSPSMPSGFAVPQVPAPPPLNQRPDDPGFFKPPTTPSPTHKGTQDPPQQLDNYEHPVAPPAIQTTPPNLGQSFFQYIPSPTLSAQQKVYFTAASDRMIQKNDFRFVRIHTPWFTQQEIPINLPTLNVLANLSEKAIHDNGSISWMGETKQIFGRMSFVVNKDMITGSFRIMDDHYYRIIPLGEGLHVLINYNNIQAYECGSLQHYVPQIKERVMSASDPVPGAQIAAGNCKIRLFLAYTTQVHNASADIGAFVQNMIDDFNSINANSNVTSRVELARSYETNYVETNAATTHPDHSNWTGTPVDLIRLQNPTDGFMDEIPQLVDLYDADLTCLAVTMLPSLGGMAYDYGTSATNSYCIAVWNNGIPNTLQHEYGHLITFHHDIFVDPAPNNYTNYEYEHGYYYIGAGTKFRTVMAYNNGCSAAGQSCPVVDNWSNPLIFISGNATGTFANENNAVVYNFLDGTVAAHQAMLQNKSLYTAQNIRDGEEANLEGNITLTTNNYSCIFRNNSIGNFRAGSSVTLKPGFNAKRGATFKAYIDNCTNSFLVDDAPDPDSRTIHSTPVILGTDKLDSEYYNRHKVHISAYPNPAHAFTTLQFNIPTNADARIQIYDISGKVVQQVLTAPTLVAGIHQIDVNLADIPPGVYTCTLISAGGTSSVHLVVQ